MSGDPDKVQTARQVLDDAVREHAPASFSSSFGVEDMVLLDLIAKDGLPVEVFTLDTGRLHPETLDLVERARDHYGVAIRVLYPEAAALEGFVTAQGPNAFYRSVELRKQCCAIRKVEPLKRALQGRKLWITGLRRSQAVTREALPVLSFDDGYGLWKLSPLADWSADEVWGYVRAHGVPVNALHAKGFPSIGCAPCTRAIQPHEHERAGRWWWEQPEQKECGLHLAPDGRLVRAPKAEAGETV